MNYRDLNGAGDADEPAPEQTEQDEQTTDAERDERPPKSGGQFPTRTAARFAAVLAVVVLIGAGAFWAGHRSSGRQVTAPSTSISASGATGSTTITPAPTTPAAAPPPPAATSTAPRTTATAPAGEPSDGAPVPAGNDPTTAATTFLKTWGRPDLGQDAWNRNVQALCDDRGWFTIEGTQVANLPQFDITGAATITPQPANSKTVQVNVPTTGGASVITFVHSGSQLLVHNFVPPGGTD